MAPLTTGFSLTKAATEERKLLEASFGEATVTGCGHLPKYRRLCYAQTELSVPPGTCHQKGSHPSVLHRRTRHTSSSRWEAREVLLLRCSPLVTLGLARKATPLCPTKGLQAALVPNRFGTTVTTSLWKSASSTTSSPPLTASLRCEGKDPGQWTLLAPERALLTPIWTVRPRSRDR